MELIDALRSTGSIRKFTDEPVADEVLWSILDDARFAPSGGNRQAWHVIVVRDAALRRTVRDSYLDAWHDYVGHVLAGLVPFSPLASDNDRAAALAQREKAVTLSKPDGFPETLNEVPAMLLVCADLTLLAATDRDLERYPVAGGASIYPFVWSILLAARARDLAGVITTVATRNEADLLAAFSLPPTFAVACVIALGYPTKRHTKLTRAAVKEFTTIDTFDGAEFTADQTN
jgi:nitroreductase